MNRIGYCQHDFVSTFFQAARDIKWEFDPESLSILFDKQVDYISARGGTFMQVLEAKILPAFEIQQKRAEV